MGLYAEQLSGTAFTCPRETNRRSWLYRIRPSVTHTPFQSAPAGTSGLREEGTGNDGIVTPNQLRWHPKEMPLAGSSVDFATGLATMCFHGEPMSKSGIAIHMYTCNADMVDNGFCNADGDMLIVPQENTLIVRTEWGHASGTN